MDGNLKEIGRSIKKSRERLGLTQDQMAKNILVSRRYYWSLEKGTSAGGQQFRISLQLISHVFYEIEKSFLGESIK